MSLNCLTCQNLPRVDSEKELTESSDKPLFTLRRFKNVDRTWSGNLAPPRPYEKIRNHNESAMARKAAKNNHHRLHGSGPIGYDNGPKLVRSSGMRRDWSFEDLKQRREVQGH
ncbi:hypothetical protein ACSBR2_040711 [Camellia fascicularis]